MPSRKDMSLSWGAGLTGIGIFGVILFIFNSNTAFLTFFQIFSDKITLEFLQVMSVFFLIGGIIFLVDGAKASS